MPKKVFKALELERMFDPVHLEAPSKDVFTTDDLAHLEGGEGGAPIDAYTGPSREEIEAELNELRRAADAEIAEKRRAAEEEAAEIIKKAENGAFDRIKESQVKSKKIAADAETEANVIRERAQAEKERLVAEAQERTAAIEKDAREEGYRDGRDLGFADGKEEVRRLNERLHSIINAVIDRRQEILERTEGQIVSLVVEIARKVVKVITETQRGVIIQNITEAVKKIKGKTELVIRVNLDDLEIATAHKEEFIKEVEGIKGLRIIEDSRVERGGCIVEADYGNIDARIGTQLTEIEKSIREISPEVR